MATRGADGWGSATPAPAVLRAGAILKALAGAQGRPMTIAELAATVGAPRSSIGNICAALQQVGMVSLGDHGFLLGRALPELGQAYLESFQPVRLFDEHCQLLGSRLEETAQLATLDGLDVVYLARRDGIRRIGIASQVGRRLPATCTAVGKAMLAMLPQDELVRRLGAAEPFTAPTSHAATTASELVPELDRTRERGYAIDDEETTEGIYCLGVAVPALPGGAGEYAVSISLVKLPGTEKREPALVELLHDLAAGVSGRTPVHL
jgi:DNA-binding IclR family transcriptional regulator